MTTQKKAIQKRDEVAPSALLAAAIDKDLDVDKLEKLIGYLETGPPAARVLEVVTSWSEYSGVYTGFTIRY